MAVLDNKFDEEQKGAIKIGCFWDYDKYDLDRMILLCILYDFIFYLNEVSKSVKYIVDDCSVASITKKINKCIIELYNRLWTELKNE